MKTIIPSSLSLAAAVLTSVTSVGLAQIADEPAGVPPEPPSSSPATTPPRPSSFVTILTPLGNDDMTGGGVIFIPAGEIVTLVGRIGGMEPNRRYEMVLLPAGTPLTDLAPGGVSPAGRPGGNTPAFGVTGAEHTAGESLGMLTADANGAAIWDTALRKNQLAKFPEGLAGCIVVIKRAPPLDTPGERRTVAAGTVVAIPGAAPAPYR